MTGTVSPQVPEQPVPVLTVPQIRALFKACEGKDFASRRDMAIVRLFLDTGIRLAELAVEDVDLGSREALVLGKGRRTRVVVYGHKATLAWIATCGPVPCSAAPTCGICGCPPPDAPGMDR